VKLLEFEAKQILAGAHIAVPVSTVIRKGDHPSLQTPLVLKSQVPTGGRGKAGGIKVVEQESDIDSTINNLFQLSIKGFTPAVILAEEKLNIKNEYYLSLLIDKPTAEIRLVANKNGGVEVEDNGPATFLNTEIHKNNFEAVGQQLADQFDLQSQAFALQDLVEKLYTCFVSNDATLLEINPLILTTDNEFVAGDCKMELDDNAAFRHNWNFEEKPAEVNFVTLDENGTVATIANGAGLAMATVDAVAERGMSPANFLDIGGGANTETVLAAFKRIVEYPYVKAIVINIFAGITRCDEVAKAIIAAEKQITSLPPLFIRLSGTNFDEAKILLDGADIPLLGTLEDCLQAAKQVAL
jgi:succinyl-CoA synthetase beta subunit